MGLKCYPLPQTINKLKFLELFRSSALFRLKNMFQGPRLSNTQGFSFAFQDSANEITSRKIANKGNSISILVFDGNFMRLNFFFLLEK